MTYLGGQSQASTVRFLRQSPCQQMHEAFQTNKQTNLQTTHLQYRNKPRAFFERRAKSFTLSQNEMREVTATGKEKISYTVADKIAKAKKRHTIAETSIFAMRNRDCQGII